MKDEYDFSEATRGKFFVSDADLIPPLHLEIEVLRTLSEKAEAGGISLSELVNDLLKRDIALAETLR